ncbi:vWA domain-containing protein [Scandinavium lactucae]|uniref:VWA domain-containing protein n=1 Tax=Scandinavium lactucae TaxID=3095028 RepID=A0ABU4QPB4_9ENTR|nr:MULTISPECIES: VWA domain-containing protein [unclassified Scandinavium]MDX6039105.1 VWA domain-containing protein [Scandinavium sp. V105_6]MDX6050176.1 VWA domain-containing protein [Scandinavium sp. V105_1]
MSDFHFIYPWRLLGLIIAALLAFLPYAQASSWPRIMDKPFAKALIIGRNKRLTQVLPWLFALGIIALAGPSWQRELPAALTPESNVMVVMQQDLAMYAQDLTPSRNERMQSKISRLMEQSPGARFGLVVYSNQAFVTTPLTQDPQFFSLFLHAQTPSLMPEGTGSGLKSAIDLAIKNSPVTPRSLILVADTLTDADAAYLEKHDVPLQIWVPGTAAGGTLPEQYAGRGIDTRLNVERFRAVRETGIPVTLVTGDGSDLQVVKSHIQQAISQQNNARSDLHWKNSGWLLAIPMLILLFFWRRQLICVAFVMPLMFWSSHSDAAWLDAWVSPDIQGQRAFDKGQFQKAAEHFRDPLWQGIAWYNARNFPAAVNAFRRAPQTPETLLWTGNSLAQQKQWQQALDTYDLALSLRPDWKMARDNREKVSHIVMQLRLKQREAEQEQGSNQDDEGPDKVLKDLKKGQGVKQKDIGAIKGSSPQLNQWYENLQVSPSGLLESLYRNGAQETTP